MRRLDAVLSSAVERGDVPGVVGLVANSADVLYEGAFGLAGDSVFRLLSMTKPVTSLAALQLVERGKLGLDDTAAAYVAAVAEAKVLDGGELRSARSAITVRQLLNHTAGFGYPYWSKGLRDYAARTGMRGASFKVLHFDPGQRWLYGVNTDVLGRVVEAVSGMTLESYFQANILGPLGMRDTGFSVEPDKLPRLAREYARMADGGLNEINSGPPESPRTFSGGAGLYGTGRDYVRFMQMILRNGDGVVNSAAVRAMGENQIGDLEAGRLESADLAFSKDAEFHPGSGDKFGFGFLVNPAGYEGGRSAGSMTWAGALNTFFWIDPAKNLCAALLMQVKPFFDARCVKLLSDFERAVYER